MKETRVQSLVWEDLLEQEMETHSSILAWKNSMDRGAWQAIVHGVTKSQAWLRTEPAHTTTNLSYPWAGLDSILYGHYSVQYLLL